MSAYDYCGEPGLVWYSKVEKKLGAAELQLVRDDVQYDVVDPDSICDPMGNPA